MESFILCLKLYFGKFRTHVLKCPEKQGECQKQWNYLCCNAATVHCCSNYIKGLGEKVILIFTQGKIENWVPLWSFPRKLLYKDTFKSFRFLSLKVVNMIAALSIFIVNETEFRLSGCASFVGWLPQTNADVPLGDQRRTILWFTRLC